MSDFIVSLLWFLLFFGGGIYLAYQRIDLFRSTVAVGAAVLAYLVFGDGHWLWNLFLLTAFGVMVVPNLIEFRREKITKPLLSIYRRMLPSMSETEREALEAGNVWWDGELFSGMPEWDRLMSYPAPKLSEEEQAFIDGPCEELCHMLDDWEVCHERADMSPEIWDYIIKHRFFAMIIPKQYGGLEFSAYANAAVITKLASRSPTASSTVGVPNSLGPAELLLHYGTEEQKQHYLPGLAAGTEIPCFALTSPQAGSDAAALIDNGVICKGKWNGKTITGIRLNWDKRYITLAPVATVLGLAFKLYDPDHLIGDKDEYGITAALIPTEYQGRRGRAPALSAQHSLSERANDGEKTSLCRSITSSAVPRWPARVGRCWSNCCRSAAPSRCRRRPPAVARLRATRPAPTPAFASSSIRRSRISKALARHSHELPDTLIL